MINLCKCCKNVLFKDKSLGVNWRTKDRKLCQYDPFLLTHEPMTNLEYLEWCAEKKGLLDV